METTIDTSRLERMVRAVGECDQDCWNCMANTEIKGFETVPCRTVCDVLTLLVDQI